MESGNEQPVEASTDPFVLLVEDDAHTRESLVYLLEEEGFTLVTAANGAEALERLEAGGNPRLILLDLTMPVMNGAELAEMLQQDARWASIPIVLMSGVDDVHRQALQVHADGYLRKPVDPRILLEVVRSYYS